MEYRKVVQREFIFQTIINGTFSVDTFFFTSGLLVSFLYFRTNEKGKLDHPIAKNANGFLTGLFHFVGLILYRFARYAGIELKLKHKKINNNLPTLKIVIVNKIIHLHIFFTFQN